MAFPVGLFYFLEVREMHQALYRKYRPAVFEDVCGQAHVTDVLRYEAERGRVSHAYLFCGSRGTGKTTCAKILAKAVNCESPVGGSPCCKCRSCLDIDAGLTTDVIEMDAASNNGVDTIRDLCDEVVYTPSMLSKKVYIIDEVHMLSAGAFNALLKTIEEPPAHVVFILATTELHKIPATIVSRCQRFEFRRINMNVIADRLAYIAEREGMTLEREAAQLIARQAQGGMRDAIGLFELCGAGGRDVTAERVKSVLGLSGYDRLAETMKAVKRADMAELFRIIADVVESSKDVAVFWQELISFVRDMLVAKYSDNSTEYLDLTESEAEMLKDVADSFNLPALVYFSKVLDECNQTMTRNPQNKRVTAEMGLLRMCRPELDTSGEALSARIAKLEDNFTLMSMGEAPIAEVKPKAEAPKAAPKAEEKKAEPVADSEEYRSVHDISDAVGKFDGASRGLVQFLMNSGVSVSADGKKAIIDADGFGYVMLDKAESKAAIADAFALARITSGRAEITVRKKSPAQDVKTASDDLGELL